MAVITTLTTLTTAVQDYLARSDLSTFVPNFIQNFEERLLRDPENWGSWMESALSVTITNNVAAVPANYLGLRIAYLTGGRPLKRITLEQLYSRYPRGQSGGGTTAFIARNGASFEFGPLPASGTLLGTYFAKPTLIRNAASDAVAHYLIVNAPDLLLYGALLEAMPFIGNDERIQTWVAAKELAMETYRAQFLTENSSGSAPFTVAM